MNIHAALGLCWLQLVMIDMMLVEPCCTDDLVMFAISLQMNFYSVYRVRCPEVYSSWRSCQEQVNGYSNNSYEGFETLEEAQQNYYKFVNAIDELPHELPAQPAHEVVPEVPNEVPTSRIKDFIIIALLSVIVKLIFF